MLLSTTAQAITPQTGIYWDPRSSGWALYLENQKNTLFAVFYAYSNTDGSPEFYFASGPILSSVDFDALPREGLYPIQGFSSPLFRVPSGPCLACQYTPLPPSEQIGSLQLAFPSRGSVYAKIFFSDGRVFPIIEEQFGMNMQRFNFALGGTQDRPTDRFPLVPDMRGEWVFTDQSNRSRAAWRFDFTTREEGVSLSTFPVRTSVIFRDVTRNALMYCFAPETAGMTAEQRAATPNDSCELRQGGETLFWNVTEVVIDEFVGTLGSNPPRSAGVFRGPNRVLGRRLSE